MLYFSLTGARVFFREEGEHFAEATKVKMVFVDGAKYDVFEQPAGREGGRPGNTAGGAPTAPATLSGHWTLNYTTGQGSETATADLTQGEDGNLSGSLTGSQGSVKVTTGSVTGSRFTFSAIVPRDGNQLNVVFSGTIEGNRLTGTLRAGDFSTDFTATRPNRDRKSVV